MRSRSKQRLTAAQFYALPETECIYELVQGRIVAEPPAGALHGAVAARIGWLLNRYIANGGRRGVVLTCDTWFELAPTTVRGPDVAFLSMERFDLLDDVNAAVPGAPDLAVELISPSESVRAMAAKASDYLAAGAIAVWVVDPREQTVAVYGRGEPVVTLQSADTLEAPELLPGFSVAVRELFALG